MSSYNYSIRNQLIPCQCSAFCFIALAVVGAQAQTPKIQSDLKIKTEKINEKSRLALDQGAVQIRQRENSGELTAASNDEIPENNDMIIVTGSHIRGAAPSGARVDIYGSVELDRSGYATIQAFLQTLPQNFSGGGGNEGASTGSLTSSNQLGGSSVNLRGLGSDSSLVLVNGRRLPSSGLEGNFTDISSIPQTAVERIEILPDGASALYGSDAVGGVVNIILREDFQGAETRLRYGQAPKGNLDEYRIGQTFGHSWDSGNIIFSYEYYQRDPLEFSERSFTRSLDLRPLGGSDHRLYFSSPGNILDPTTFLPAYAIPSGQDGRNITTDDLIFGHTNLMDRTDGTQLLPTQRRHSIFLYVTQNVSDKIKIFGDIRYSERHSKFAGSPEIAILTVPSVNPFFIDPFGSDFVRIAYQFGNDLGPITSHNRIESESVSTGANITLSRWEVDAYVAHSREKSKNEYDQLDYNSLNQALYDTNPETAFNPFGDKSSNNLATLESLRSPVVRRPRSTINSAKLVADGPLFSFNDNDVSLALGAEYRKEKFRHWMDFQGQVNPETRLSRNIYSLFSEIYIPAVSPENNIPAIHSLDLSIATRYDKYSDFGSTTNPKIGATWKFSSEIAVKAAYGTSYRAPNLTERATDDNATFITQWSDPRSATGFSNVLLLSGNDPEMDSETADTLTLGLSLKPAFVSALQADFTYFYINYKNRIARPNSPQTILSNEAIYGELIRRNPPSNILQQLCKPPFYLDDPAQCNPLAVDAVVDIRTKNIASSKVKGVDFKLSYAHSFGNISLSTGADATYLIDFKNKISDLSDSIDLVDTLGNPIDFRARAYASLSSGAISGTITSKYYNSYRNNISTVQKNINSHVEFDITLSVRFGTNFIISNNGPYEVGLSAVNIFDNKPPFADNRIAGYDGDNFSPIGRFIAAEFRAIW